MHGEGRGVMRKLLIACLLVGCGTTKVVQYAPPVRAQRTGPPPTVTLDDVSPPFRRDPLAMVDHDVLPMAPAGATAKDPHFLIAEANHAADTEPEEGEADGNTQTYDYERSHSFRIYACYMESIDVMFAPGETVVESLGDKDDQQRTLAKGWRHGFTQSGDDNGHIVQVMVLRPIAENTGLRRMKVHTNVGPYTFLLEVLPREESRCMDTVRFRHPKRELKRLIAEEDEGVRAKQRADLGPGCTSMNYEVEVIEGSPRWTPTGVVRTCEGDHAKITIQFPRDVTFAGSKAPGFLCDGGVCDYRFVPEEKTIVYDGVFTTAVLKLGSKEQGYERVAIHALKEPR
jgi:type IV secretory pathway VirB9-like protein